MRSAIRRAARDRATTHSVTLANLAPNATYHFRVRSTDGSGNVTTSPAVGTDPLSFTMPSASLRDTTVADFSAGTLAGTSISATVDGEVTLGAGVATDFDGSTLPNGWESGAWTGGTAIVAGGQLTADGAYARTTATYGPSRVLEFRATFGNTTFQNAGFGVDFNTTPRWAAFGIGNSGGQLYARVNNGTEQNVPLGAGYFGSAHSYRIEWMPTEIRFYVDGSLVHTSGTAITDVMRPIVSDYTNGAPALTIDWLRMSPPYATSGTFTSRVFDAGQEVGWAALDVDTQAPDATSLALSVRTGDTADPDASWSNWTPVVIDADIPGSSRYVQYRASLATTDTALTPVLEEVRIGYADAETDTTPPTVTGTVPVDGAINIDPVSSVSASFTEPMDAATIDETSFTLRAGATDVAASVSYASGTATLTPAAPLVPATAYTATVTTAATDLAGNPLTQAYTWTYTTAAAPEPPTGLTDTTVADFGGGTLGGTTVTAFGNGEVTLAPAVGSAFDGTGLPSGWTGSAWDGGAPPVVGGGTVTLDQDLLVTDALYAPSRTLEFVANFSAQNQHIGFANDFNNGQWAIFSTGADGDQLYARSNASPGHRPGPRRGLSERHACVPHRVDRDVGDVLHRWSAGRITRRDLLGQPASGGIGLESVGLPRHRLDPDAAAVRRSRHVRVTRLRRRVVRELGRA